jgi:hypothetical protein
MAIAERNREMGLLEPWLEKWIIKISIPSSGSNPRQATRFSLALQTNAGHGHLILEVTRSHK